jgi:hypothetical protein
MNWERSQYIGGRAKRVAWPSKLFLFRVGKVLKVESGSDLSLRYYPSTFMQRLGKGTKYLRVNCYGDKTENLDLLDMWFDRHYTATYGKWTTFSSYYTIHTHTHTHTPKCVSHYSHYTVAASLILACLYSKFLTHKSRQKAQDKLICFM